MNPITAFGYNSNGTVNITSPVSPHYAFGEVATTGQRQHAPADRVSDQGVDTGVAVVLAIYLGLVLIAFFVAIFRNINN